MSKQLQENELTPEEKELAYQHWDALMFAPSRFTLETARQELGKAPLCVQLAVMEAINELWLRCHEPSREENPFL